MPPPSPLTSSVFTTVTDTDTATVIVTDTAPVTIAVTAPVTDTVTVTDTAPVTIAATAPVTDTVTDVVTDTARVTLPNKGGRGHVAARQELLQAALATPSEPLPVPFYRCFKHITVATSVVVSVAGAVTSTVSRFRSSYAHNANTKSLHYTTKNEWN